MQVSVFTGLVQRLTYYACQHAFLLLRAQDYDALALRCLLPGIEFETAIETIEIIPEKTEDKQTYDQREKAQRDYEWALSGAREEGVRLGMEERPAVLRLKIESFATSKLVRWAARAPTRPLRAATTSLARCDAGNCRRCTASRRGPTHRAVV